ncbi:hypothetical protein QYE76_011235 [Lolium multiflorum]|uniref:Reverse transcriptase domain-containing protein n=1 Tax=Lolium multiflorum TaxID=4521 RepID=A0AAD8TYL0_LOLMU|nr:hypothetical protein QYE76_011235 [Lolium multiflorum]
MTFGEFRFGVNKEGSYRLEVPISSEFSAVDSNFSSSDEEFSSPRFVDNKASGKLAKIFSNTSFESSADSIISSDSDSVDSFNFIDKSAAIGKIRLKEEDEAKTAFITPYGVFCYKTMPFGLKNAGATYQRMMQKCLATQIGKNVQVYIDDVVITSKKGSTLIEDLKETFDNLDKFCIKLNPTKCSFGVPAGELLGFLVSARGIEANPEKIQAIVTMRKPTKLKEIQQLTGRVAALSRFVARLGEKALPFYALIKQGEKFQWNEEADRAFENLKRTISTPPILVAPKEKEPLLLYIAATPQKRKQRRRIEESAQSGEPPQAPTDPEQAAILASLNAQRYQRLREEEREFVNDANLEHVLEISRQRAVTEEAGRRLKEAERQKLAELNAHRHQDAFARQQARRAEIEASRERLEARGQRRRQAPATPAAMLHRQMREATKEKRARTQAAMAKNNDEAVPSSAPTDGP